MAPSDPRNCVGYAIKELYLGTDFQRWRLPRIAAPHAGPGADRNLLLVHRSMAHRPISVNTHEAQVGFDLFFKAASPAAFPP